MKSKREKKQPREYSPARIAVWTSIFGLLFLVGCSIFSLGIWYERTFDLSFNELLYTLISPLKGTGVGTIELILRSCLPWVCLAAILFVAVALVISRRGRIYRYCRGIGAGFCCLVLTSSLIFAVITLHLPEYFKSKSQQTYIYEEYYIDPEGVQILSTTETPRNLIYIYLESMETTYASTIEGGSQDGINYIPNLTELAKQELFFTESNIGLLGGFQSPAGAYWTMGALLATTAGIPFSFPIDGNSGSNREKLAGGVCAIGDVLSGKGYRQMFLCGSDSEFGGRRNYFETHGKYEIFDYHTAKEKGYIPDDYYVWWGYEDAILYEIAKDQLTELASGDQPFNLTMLTVDTHHVDGYVCEKCDESYGDRLGKVLYCADQQISGFIDWCREQPFYENTTIVITGDHRRMDTTYVADVDPYDRTIYNCFINPATEPKGDTVGRVFTSFDMFPTTLAAMGYSIEGERLGLGVNLFSTVPTLSEQLGYDYLNWEICKYSQYYLMNFS